MAQGRVRPNRVVAGSSGTELFPANPGRLAMQFSVSVADAYYTLDGTTPSATNGVLVKADAAPIVFDGAGYIPVLAVTVYSSGANAVVSGHEITPFL